MKEPRRCRVVVARQAGRAALHDALGSARPREGVLQRICVDDVRSLYYSSVKCARYVHIEVKPSALDGYIRAAKAGTRCG